MRSEKPFGSPATATRPRSPLPVSKFYPLLGPASFQPLGALQQRVLGLQLRQLPAQAVHFILELLVVLDDVNHFIIGFIQTLGGSTPAQKHSCDIRAEREGGAYYRYYPTVTSSATL